jgi:hypothetical protein
MLARAGHRVTALDSDPELLAELVRRAGDLELDAVLGDARELDLQRRFALCIVPMQTIQLLGGPAGRARFLARVGGHLADGAICALALADELEPFDVRDGVPAPLPDVCERDGTIYASRPTAVRTDGEDGYVLERRREIVSAGGVLSAERNLIRLDRLTPAELEREATAAGLTAAGRTLIAPTEDHVGSVVVMLGG